jgi:hypothetical protein
VTDALGYWLVIAFSHPGPLGNMKRAKSGKVWWRRCYQQREVDELGRLLTKHGIQWSSSWKDNDEVIERQEKLREEEFRAFQRDWREPTPQPKPNLNQNRDRSGGRPSYAQFRRKDLVP